MLIKSIKLRNIRSYVDDRIEFPAGSVLLSGDVGSGKSTVLLALDFALFGTRRGELDGDALLRHGSSDGYVELEFQADNKDIKIKRSLKRKASILQDSGELIINGIRKELSPNELKAKIFELLGYPQDIMKKNKPIFRFTVYTPQEEMKHIMLYPDDRIEILRKIFGIDKYGLIRENVKMLITEVRSMKREAESYSRDLEEKIGQKQDIEKDKIKINEQIYEQNEIRLEIDKNLKIKKAELDEFRKEAEKIIKTKQELIRKESELESKENRKTRIENDIIGYQEKIDENEKMLKQYKAIEFDFDELKKEMNGLHKKRDDNIKASAILQNEINRLSEILEKGICSFCGQDVHNKTIFKKNINEKIEVEKALNFSIQKIDEEIESCRNNITMLEKKEQIEKNLIYVMELNGNSKNELKEIGHDVVLLNMDIELLKPKTEKFTEIDERVKMLENEFEKIQNEKFEIEKIITRLEQQIKNAENMISILDKEIENKKKSREKIAYYDELVKWLDAQFSLLMETIEKHVMYNIQQEFNRFFQEWFNILMAEVMDVRINEQFAPVIEQNGFETDYNNLSGGEKTSVALAYRLALNKVINIMIDSIKTKDLMILDEPTDGFSSEQLDRMRDVLDKLNLKQVIIVSHEPKIDTFVNNVIKICKDGHVSKIGV